MSGDSELRPLLSVEAYVKGVLEGNRVVLSRAITLVESTAPAHEELAQRVLEQILPQTGQSIRVGVTGAPGVGKSCLIEALGSRLIAQGHRVAVLAVDPSSPVSGGSILGDKTRMPRLAAEERAFIRPSPSGTSTGGVARATREAILLAEAAGHDVVLVETVGVGQTESAVRSMVDFFLLLMMAGAGDELQGLKRGVIEMADALAVTKADGDNLERAARSRAEYLAAISFLTPALEGWTVEVLTCSAVTGAGIDELWQAVERHRAHGERLGARPELRRQQARDWMRSLIAERLESRFFAHPAVAALLPEVERAVAEGALPAGAAALRLVDAFEAPPSPQISEGRVAPSAGGKTPGP
jgi:LAO/AO transport system kinase